MDEVKVSVCMVTYNHERYIAQAVESALAQQTTFPVEIVIGEDCSTDGTRAILAGLAERHPGIVRLRLADANQGAKRNFVGTFDACRGEYVTILEGDDYFTNPAKLQLQADALDAHPEWAMCFHPATCIYEDGLSGPPLYPENWTHPEATLVDLLQANFMPTAGVMFRNRLMPRLPDWFLETELGDWPLHILNAEHGAIGFLPTPMSAYRIHAGGAWSGRELTANLTAVFTMMSAVDRHFAGRYAGAIEEYRLRTLRYLVRRSHDSQLTSGNDYLELQRSYQQVINENHALRQHAADRDRLRAENDRLQAAADAFGVIAAENQWLRGFHREWSRAWTYRAWRETRRVWRQARQASLQLVRRREADPRSVEPPQSRAA